jgi:hypothetical protein
MGPKIEKRQIQNEQCRTPTTPSADDEKNESPERRNQHEHINKTHSLILKHIIAL